jgi:peptide chain release factor 1
MLLEKKAEELLARLPGLEVELSDPACVRDQKRFRGLSQEHSYLLNLRDTLSTLQKAEKELEEAKELSKSESDPSFQEILEEEIKKLEALTSKKSQELEEMLVPPDPLDSANTIIEIRAGTGGDEAALFVGDCARMYKLFADSKGWKYELLSCTASDLGGYKEFVMVLQGENVYRMLQHEGGTHRVQRVPATEAQGRIHTSAVTIAVLVEPPEDEEIEVDERDLRIDTFRSSGAGGQHVNTTDSAVRITHNPTGIVVASQEERSQHKNKEKALRVLKAKLNEYESKKKKDAITQARSEQVGSGDRSERIRTYNFPQNRITDHRINLTTHDLDRVMEGHLEIITSALVKHFHQEKLETTQ